MRMFLRYFKYPLLFFFAALLVKVFLGYFVPSVFGDIEMFSQIVSMSVGLSSYVVLLIFGIAVLLFMYDFFVYWQWENDKYDGELCIKCGGITSFNVDGHGTFYQCRFCGDKRYEGDR